MTEFDGFADFILEWRKKLFSVQTTISELLEGLELIEKHEVISPPRNRKRSRRKNTPRSSASSHGTICLEGIPSTSIEVVPEVLLKEEDTDDEDKQQRTNGWTHSQEDISADLHREDADASSSLQIAMAADGPEEESPGDEDGERSDWRGQGLANGQDPDNKMEADVSCPVCALSFRSGKLLSVHMRNYHVTSRTQQEFQCGKCNYSTHRQLNLKRHVEVTHYGKGYQCEQCDRIFTESGSLRRHVLSIHEAIRYPCDECSYKATERGSLRRHKVYIHSAGATSPAFPCHLCPFVAKLRGDLNRHLKNTHKLLPHSPQQQELLQPDQEEEEEEDSPREAN